MGPGSDPTPTTPRPFSMNPAASALLTDLYQLSMALGYWRAGRADQEAAFHLYFRSAPFVALMEDRLLPGMATRGLVDVGVVRRWWRRALSAPSTTEGFWIPVALELWAQQFIDRQGR